MSHLFPVVTTLWPERLRAARARRASRKPIICPSVEANLETNLEGWLTLGDPASADGTLFLPFL